MAKKKTSSSSSRNPRGVQELADNQPPNSVVHVFEDQMCRQTDDWAETAQKLCELLQIPDLTSRSGLKQVHYKLPLITKQLDETLSFSRKSGRTDITIGVVAIYSKMCTLDAVLQEKLISDGLYSTLIDLSKEEDTRNAALRALGSISCRAGTMPKVLQHFLHNAPTLLELAVSHSDDPEAMASLAHIFSHTAVKAEHLKSKIDTALLGRTLLEAIKKPDASPNIYGDASACFQCESYELWRRLEDLPGFLTLHVALLRSKHLEIRATALQVIRRIVESKAITKEVLVKRNTAPACPAGCIHTTRLARDVKIASLPAKLRKRLQAYGEAETEIVALQRGRAAYTTAFLEFPPEGDLRPLGRELAGMIYQEQYAIPELVECLDGLVVPRCQACHDEQTWPDLLSNCTVAFGKEKSNVQREDALCQDVLTWKTRTRTCSSRCFLDCCKELIDQAPYFPLFYYIPHRRGVHDVYAEDILRRAKKGLMCEKVPRWLRLELLWQAAESAFVAGMQKVGDRRAEEGSASLFLSSARADAKKIIDEGPPDGLRRASALGLYLSTTLILEGPECDFNDPYIKRVLADVKINKQLRKLMGCPILEGFEECINPFIMVQRLMPQAMEEWGDVIQRMNDTVGDCQHGTDSEGVDDALTHWLNAFETGEEEEEVRQRGAKMSVLHTRTGKQVVLKLCAWCGGPSAALKQCTGCGIARYCDAQCQKLHWNKHKAECNASKNGREPQGDL